MLNLTQYASFTLGCQRNYYNQSDNKPIVKRNLAITTFNANNYKNRMNLANNDSFVIIPAINNSNLTNVIPGLCNNTAVAGEHTKDYVK